MEYFIYWSNPDDRTDGIERISDINQAQRCVEMHLSGGDNVTVIRGREVKVTAIETVTKVKFE